MNLVNPEVAILHLAEAIQDAVGNHPGAAFHPAPTDDPACGPDTTLAEHALGWKPDQPHPGLTRTVAWFP